MTEYVLVHHLFLCLFLVLWVCLTYVNLFAPVKRADFLDPDFGMRASINLARRKGSKCRVGAEADSEIPELGLDSGRINVDCDVSPIKLANAALGAARDLRQQRRDRARYQSQPSKTVKRKRTRIDIVRDYKTSRGGNNNDDNDDDDDNDGQEDDESGNSNTNNNNNNSEPSQSNPQLSRYRPEGSAVSASDGGDDDEDD